MGIVHISNKIEYRQPFGAVQAGTDVVLRADYAGDVICLDLQTDSASERRLPDRVEALEGSKLRRATFLVPKIFTDAPDVCFYHFTSDEGQVSRTYQITVYEPGLDVPSWFTDSVIYQIFPDRFYRGEGQVEPKSDTFMYGKWDDLPMYIKDSAGDVLRWDFYGGNLWGVTQKFDYIRALGADIVYLNPIFESGSNHRYDTSDYMKVDGLLGGDAAFDDMLSAGKMAGLRFILDGVFSHTGDRSKYFDPSGVFAGKKAPYKDWYRFREDGTYECWWGVKSMPNVNELAPSFLSFVVTGEDSVIKHWLKRGVCGWRLDVADELPDEFIAALRQVCDDFDAVVIGEVWEDASNKISYDTRRMYYTRRELHSNTNYIFRNTMLDFLGGAMSGVEAMSVFVEMSQNYPRHNFYAQVNMTGSHDVRRLMSCMLDICDGDRGKAESFIRTYSLVQFTFPGVPLIYYGDETCLEGDTDPDNRRTYPWESSNGKMIEWFSRLASFRASAAALRSGEWMPIDGCGEDVFCYLRYNDDSIYAVAVSCDREISSSEDFYFEFKSCVASACGGLASAGLASAGADYRYEIVMQSEYGLLMRITKEGV